MTDPYTGIGPGMLGVPIEVIIIGGVAVAIVVGLGYITYKAIHHFRSQKRKIEELTRQSAAQAEKMDHVATQNDELKAQNAKLVTGHDELKAQNAKLVTGHDELKAQNIQLEIQVTNLEHQVVAVTEELVKAKASIAALPNVIAEQLELFAQRVTELEKQTALAEELPDGA